MFELKLTEQKLNVVLSALQELPYRVSREVIDDIVTQAREQAQPQFEVPDEAEQSEE